MTTPRPRKQRSAQTNRTEYTRMSKVQLIERLRELESRVAESGHPRLEVETRPHGLSASSLTDTESRIRAILETAVEAIISIDDRGIIESINPAAEKIFGYRAVELCGNNISLLMPSPFREEHDTYIANYLATGNARIIGIGREIQGMRKDGTVFPMELSVSEVRLAKSRMFTGFVRDITERKQSEIQLAELARSLAEKNKELETIVYVASHDLRSPLVNIQGFSKELAHTCDQVRALIKRSANETVSKADLQSLVAEDVPEALAFIQAGVAKMDALLSGFLRFSRLGRIALNIQKLNMNEVLAAIAQTMDYQIQHGNMRLRIDTLPPCSGDWVQVNQVFTNLIDNAIKYRSPQRAGVIHVSGTTEPGQTVYSIKDNGIGIAREHQEKAFEIFHRLDPSKGNGEGLGLAIVQRILDRQHGRIWLESSPGAGSTFFVSLPREDDSSTQQGL